MEKDEVLRRSRAEKVDEGVQRTNDAGRRTGYVLLAFLYLVVAVVDMWFDTDNRAFFAVSAVVMCFAASVNYRRWRFAKSRMATFSCVMFCLLAAVFLAAYLLTAVGVVLR